ncbi:MAG: hypothetical protein V3U11_14340, partial [Planctomycetota bacterium]
MQQLAVGALLTAVALALYGDSLGGWFLADDFFAVERVYLWWSQDPGQFLRMFVAGSPEPGGFHWPLSVLSWGLDYLAWGLNPIGYRITNLLIHVGCGLLIFRLAWRWTGGRRDISWLAALLFLVCPLHTESVAWIAARDETLAVLFFLAVLNTVPVTGAAGMTLGIFATMFAFWCKESALMLPPVVTLYYLLVAGSSPPKDRIRKAIAGSLWIWIVTVCYMANRYWVLGKFGGTYPAFEPPDYLTLEYLGSRLTYWLLLFSPLEGETFPAWLRWMAGLGTLALVASSFAARSLLKPGIVLLLACWTLLAPMPYLWENVDPHDLRHGRHLYICYAPFCILLAIGTTHIVQRVLPGSGAMRGFAAGALVILLSCATWLTKEAHVRAGVLSRKFTDEIHSVMAIEQDRPRTERPDRV